MDDNEDVVSRKTVAFLRHAAALTSINDKLAADLTVASRKHDQPFSNKKVPCGRCCLNMVPNRLVFGVQKRRRKRLRFLTVKCSYCGKKQISTLMPQKKPSKARNYLLLR